MFEIFTSAFGTTLTAVIQILFIAAAAAILIRKNVISDEYVNALSAITIRVLLPCLIFSSIIENFHPGQLRIWPLIPLGAVVMIAFGLGAGAILFIKELPEKKHMLAPAALQNAGYLILPLGKVLYPQQFDLFAMYCFLFLLGISPVLWTLGKYLVSSAEDSRPKLSQLFSPPFFANLLGVVMVFTRTSSIIPSVAVNSIKLIGSATVPIAIFVLGAVLARVHFDIKLHSFDAARVLLVKLVIMPLCTIVVLYLLGVNENYPLLAKLFVLQSAAAPATAILIQVRHYGGKEKELSSTVLLCYLFCIVSIPFWISVWGVIIS